MPALLKALGDKGAGTTVLQVQCGGAHTLALCDNGDVYAWGSNDDMQLGLGPGVGKKVNRPELVTDLSGKGILRVACGKNFSLALSESGDVYSWGAGSALQLGHGGKAGEDYPRMIEALRDVRKVAAGANSEHAAVLVGESAMGGEEEEEEEVDEIKLAEEQLEKARNRREDSLRAMTADIEALELQVNKIDAKLAITQDEGVIAAMHALRERAQEIDPRALPRDAFARRERRIFVRQADEKVAEFVEHTEAGREELQELRYELHWRQWQLVDEEEPSPAVWQRFDRPTPRSSRRAASYSPALRDGRCGRRAPVLD